MRPRCANAVRNSDFSEPTRRSRHRLNGNAIPATAPLMAAMIGFGVVIRNGNGHRNLRWSLRLLHLQQLPTASLLDSSPDEILERSFMSAPAQNARPAPVMMMPTTEGRHLLVPPHHGFHDPCGWSRHSLPRSVQRDCCDRIVHFIDDGVVHVVLLNMGTKERPLSTQVSSKGRYKRIGCDHLIIRRRRTARSVPPMPASPKPRMQGRVPFQWLAMRCDRCRQR